MTGRTTWRFSGCLTQSGGCQGAAIPGRLKRPQRQCCPPKTKTRHLSTAKCQCPLCRDVLPRVVQSWARNYIFCVALYCIAGSLWAYYIYACYGATLFGAGNMPAWPNMLEQIKVTPWCQSLHSRLPLLACADSGALVPVHRRRAQLPVGWGGRPAHPCSDQTSCLQCRKLSRPGCTPDCARLCRCCAGPGPNGAPCQSPTIVGSRVDMFVCGPPSHVQHTLLPPDIILCSPRTSCTSHHHHHQSCFYLPSG